MSILENDNSKTLTISPLNVHPVKPYLEYEDGELHEVIEESDDGKVKVYSVVKSSIVNKIKNDMIGELQNSIHDLYVSSAGNYMKFYNSLVEKLDSMRKENN